MDVGYGACRLVVCACVAGRIHAFFCLPCSLRLYHSCLVVLSHRQGGIPEIAYEMIIKTGGLPSEWTSPYVSYFVRLIHSVC